MPQTPKVSCVIVNYETSEMVKRCIASLARQSITHEAVVVDNPSAANDAVNLEGIDARIVRNAENVGYGRGNNTGANVTTGEYVCVLNPDTALPEGALEHWVAVFEREQQAGRRLGLLAPRLLNDNGTPQRSTYQFVNPLSYWLYHSILAGALKQFRKRVKLRSGKTASGGVEVVDWVMGAALLVPRKVWEEIRGFGENYFLYAEDADLCWRLREAGYQVCFTAEVSITHTQGEPSAERRGMIAKRLFAGILTFLEQHYRTPKRWAVKLCVMLDMLARIGIYTPIALLRPQDQLTRSRLRGAWEILRLYAGMPVPPVGKERV